MFNDPQPDNIDMAQDGLTRDKLLQAFAILGIPVGQPNVNSRGEVLDEMAVEQGN